MVAGTGTRVSQRINERDVVFEIVTRQTVPGVLGKLIAFCVHQVLAVPGALLGTMVTVWPGVALVHLVLRVVVRAPVRSAEVATNVFMAAWGGLVAWLLGRLAGRIAPIWAPFGRFVWVLPSAVLCLALGSDLQRMHTPYPPNLLAYFGGAAKGEDGLAFFLATLPVILSPCYAWGLRCGAEYSKRFLVQDESASEQSVDASATPGN